MLKVESKIKYKKHIWTNYENGYFSYDSCDIDYSFKTDSKYIVMDIHINSSVRENLLSVFLEILDFLYLAFGTMPIIVYYKENGIKKDLEHISSRYFPSDQLFSNEHLIDITKESFNEKNLVAIKNIIRNKPFEIFWAFSALTSKAYEHIYAEHRIILLLHCFEGYIYNKDVCFQNRKVSFKDRISEILNIFFYYDEKYDTEILKTLSLSKEEYLKTLKDTRHQFSHYINQDKPLSDGKDYIVNFVLLHYVFRIFLLKETNIVPNEKNIEEFLKSIYDWINTLKHFNFKNYKSVAYQMSMIWDN